MQLTLVRCAYDGNIAAVINVHAKGCIMLRQQVCGKKYKHAIITKEQSIGCHTYVCDVRWI